MAKAAKFFKYAVDGIYVRAYAAGQEIDHPQALEYARANNLILEEKAVESSPENKARKGGEKKEK